MQVFVLLPRAVPIKGLKKLWTIFCLEYRSHRATVQVQHIVSPRVGDMIVYNCNQRKLLVSIWTSKWRSVFSQAIPVFTSAKMQRLKHMWAELRDMQHHGKPRLRIFFSYNSPSSVALRPCNKHVCICPVILHKRLYSILLRNDTESSPTSENGRDKYTVRIVTTLYMTMLLCGKRGRTQERKPWTRRVRAVKQGY